jgi:hypothetical protein
MKSAGSSANCSVVVLLALCAVLAGCFPKRVVWSPDGKQAVVLGENGLYLCDADGKISGLLVSNVTVAAWFPDSQRIALARRARYGNWSEAQRHVTTDIRDRIVAQGQSLLKDLKAGGEFNAALADANEKMHDDSEKNLVGLYLRSLDGVKQLVGQNWDLLQAMQFEQVTLHVGSVADGKLSLGPPMYSGPRMICELRVAPGGTAIAYTIESGAKDDYSLYVVAAEGSSPAQLVAEHASWYPDWSVDGRSLVYIKSATATGGGDQLSLGSLSRRKVLDDAGRPALQTDQDELAGLLFQSFNRVRCLPDGRIIFSSAELHIPTTTVDMPERQQLFALDPARQSTLTPLIPQSAQAGVPDFVCFFEPSPDGKRVSIYGEKGEVVVLTLASGKVDVVQSKPESSGDSVSVPVWRSNDELSFISFQKSTNVVRAEVTLWRGGTNRVISAPWPDEVREKFLDKWVVNDAPRQDHLNQMRDK